MERERLDRVKLFLEEDNGNLTPDEAIYQLEKMEKTVHQMAQEKIQELVDHIEHRYNIKKCRFCGERFVSTKYEFICVWCRKS